MTLITGTCCSLADVDAEEMAGEAMHQWLMQASTLYYPTLPLGLCVPLHMH